MRITFDERPMLKYDTVEDLTEKIWTMVENLSVYKESWRLDAKAREHLDNAQSELNLFIEHITRRDDQ